MLTKVVRRVEEYTLRFYWEAVLGSAFFEQRKSSNTVLMVGGSSNVARSEIFTQEYLLEGHAYLVEVF